MSGEIAKWTGVVKSGQNRIDVTRGDHGATQARYDSLRGIRASERGVARAGVPHAGDPHDRAVRAWWLDRRFLQNRGQHMGEKLV